MTIRQLLIVSRPRFWVYLVGPYVIALAAAGTWPNPTLLLFGLYLTLPANLLIYGINDIFDRETDRLNSKKQGYETLLSDKSVRPIALLIAVTNLPFLLYLGVSLTPAANLWLLVFIVTGIGYSLPPIRAKARPIIDSLFNILYVAPAFAVYVAASGQLPSTTAIIAATLWCMAMHAYSAVPDITADRASRTPTVATLLNRRPTLWLCGVAYVVAAGLSIGLIGWPAIVGGIVYLTLIILSLRTKTDSQLFRLYTWFPLVNTVLGAGLFFVVLFH
jgi:4-hydroxybenzoate polyprenyltransferase